MKALVSIVLLLGGPGLVTASACGPPAANAAESGRVVPRSAARMPAPQAARRARLVAGEKVERVPVWPDARESEARARLTEALRAAVDASPVPVLAPRAGWADLRISSPRGPGGPGFGYTLSARAGGRTLTVQGSRIATLIEGVGRHEGKERLRGVFGFLTENEGVRSASWIENGIAYSLDLECDDTRSAQCSEDAARAEVEALAYVGGAGHGGAP